MRRLFFALLLLVLPFQFAWGVAAGYCAHEKAAGASHFGHHSHHSHQHQVKSKADTVGAAVDKKTDPLAGDPDCALCHFGCVQPPLRQRTPFVDEPAESRAPSETSHAGSSSWPDRIERPKWIFAA